MAKTRLTAHLTSASLILSLALLGCSGKGVTRISSGADKDADGVRNDQDKCGEAKEDGFPPDTKDGCPSDDPDGDTVTGAADRCPYQAETRNGNQDDDGCPDGKSTVTKAARVTVTKTAIKIEDKILFAFGKAVIEQESNSLIKEIADVMKANPQVELIAVAGHADRIGNDITNVDLTKRRAAAVVDALVALGVDKARLRPAGYGRYCPIDPAETDAAREKNRRVEFQILRQAGKETGVDPGCPEATKKGIKLGA